MARGVRSTASLAVICLLAGACGRQSPPPHRRTIHRISNAVSIALSTLGDSVYILDPETGRTQRTIRGLDGPQAGYADWAPDHRRLAFGNDSVVILDIPTNRRRVLAQGPLVSMPTWSPGGTRIAYGDGRDLWITPTARLNAAYMKLPLTLAPEAMAWGPAGLVAFQGVRLRCQIPYGCSSTNRSDIWTVRPDGSDLRRLTRLGQAGLPKWSPDGSRLLFITRDRAHGRRVGELWSIGAGGTGLFRVLRAANVVAADWSPDGSRLAVVRTAGTNSSVRLWIGSADGSNLHPIGPPVAGTAATVDW